jgi:thiamine biosynthesis protein ThiS
MRVKVNGEDRDVADNLDINGLIAEHHLTPDKVAVELNRRLVRRDKYGTTLKEGDQIEIVTFVGGGS